MSPATWSRPWTRPSHRQAHPAEYGHGCPHRIVFTFQAIPVALSHTDYPSLGRARFDAEHCDRYPGEGQAKLPHQCV